MVILLPGPRYAGLRGASPALTVRDGSAFALQRAGSSPAGAAGAGPRRPVHRARNRSAAETARNDAICRCPARERSAAWRTGRDHAPRTPAGTGNESGGARGPSPEPASGPVEGASEPTPGSAGRHPLGGMPAGTASARQSWSEGGKRGDIIYRSASRLRRCSTSAYRAESRRPRHGHTVRSLRCGSGILRLRTGQDRRAPALSCGRRELRFNLRASGVRTTPDLSATGADE